MSPEVREEAGITEVRIALRLGDELVRQEASGDPVAAPLLAAAVEVIPAEIATLADVDLALTASGGIG